jgi:hypothetical protein
LQLKHLDAIATNFRVKEVFCSDNMIKNLDGLKKFKFLNSLLIANNKLRDLEKFLAILKKFAFLEKLDLFGNPLAEEPDYRMKVIWEMPQLKVLDRHPITVEERIKAEKMDPEWERNQAKKLEELIKAEKKNDPDWEKKNQKKLEE